MRIAIDAHAIGSRLTGNERYITNLADELLRLDHENEYIFSFTREEIRQRWANRAPNLQTCLVSANPFRRLTLDFALQFRALRPDIFHYQYTGPALHLTREIVTIHDVSFERYPELFRPIERVRLQLTVRQAARRARRIITESEFSKREIVHFLGVPEDRVKVIYNGVGPEFRVITDSGEIENTLRRHDIRRPYLLAVGNVSRRKNHRAAVRGLARWLSRRPDSEIQLVLAGKPQDAAPELLAEATKLGVQHRLKILGFVPEADLPYLYAGAELLLYTSFYEGFGLPLVEAMQCGVPIIASRASCFPEIVADAARLVDPEDPGDIAQALDEILGSAGTRNELTCRGLRRAQNFRWDVAAKETLKVYYEAFEDSQPERPYD